MQYISKVPHCTVKHTLRGTVSMGRLVPCLLPVMVPAVYKLYFKVHKHTLGHGPTHIHTHAQNNVFYYYYSRAKIFVILIPLFLFSPREGEVNNGE